MALLSTEEEQSGDLSPVAEHLYALGQPSHVGLHGASGEPGPAGDPRYGHPDLGSGRRFRQRVSVRARNFRPDSSHLTKILGSISCLCWSGCCGRAR